MHKPIFFISISLLILSSCQTDFDDFQKSISETAKDGNDILNTKFKSYEKIQEEVRIQIENDTKKGIVFLDSIVLYDYSMWRIKKANLLIFSSEVLYTLGEYELAIKQCEKAEKVADMKGSNYSFNKARAHSKIGEYETAEKLLNNALNYRQDFYWSIGNLYEMQNDTANAIANYKILYNKNPYKYSFAKDRAILIANGDSLLTELDIANITADNFKITISN